MAIQFGSLGDLIQDVRYPGLPRVESFSYTCSHGIKPGVIQVTTYPLVDDITPARVGTMYVTDGYRVLPLRDVKFDLIEGQYTNENGTSYSVRFFDRRWRWGNQYGGFGSISGRYNQLDRRGKLVPWSIRSPEELIRLCLRALGEFNYVIVAPPGLRRAVGANLDRYLRLGEFFPHTNTNPDVIWDNIPPAEALLKVCERLGLRVVYQPYSNRILVVPLGYGARDLPTNAPYEMLAPSLDDPETPSAIGIAGDFVRVQFRAPLEPVAEEWDGSHVPIDDVSYAPSGASNKQQITAVDWTSSADPSYGLFLDVTWGAKEVHVWSTDPTFTIAQRWAEIISRLEADTDFASAFTVTAAGNTLTIKARNTSTVFTVTATGFYSGSPPADLATAYKVRTVQSSSAGGRSWGNCPPPYFRAVQATERLAYMEAISHAARSVWRRYRLMNADPHTRKPPLVLPWFGQIDRIQQIVLQSTKVEQVVPQPRVAGGVNKGSLLPFGASSGVLPEFYNGRSRDQEATVHGSVYSRLGRVLWMPKTFHAATGGFNTPPGDRIWCDFQTTVTDTGDTIVEFGEYVYKWNHAAPNAAFYEKPELTLESSCYVLDPDTDHPIRWTKLYAIPGGTGPIEWHTHEDIKVGIVGIYGTTGGIVGNAMSNRLLGWKYAEGDLEHANPAADSYALHHAKKYVTVLAKIGQYVGIYPFPPDGSLQQVTWRLGPGGPTTIASVSTEHSIYVPPWYVRRRPELLPPDYSSRLANLTEREYVNKLYQPVK